jgi:hypothetical protein
MKRVSKRVATLFALAAFALVVGGQPAFAAPKAGSEDRGAFKFLRSIVKRILDMPDISFPPG